MKNIKVYITSDLTWRSGLNSKDKTTLEEKCWQKVVMDRLSYGLTKY